MSWGNYKPDYVTARRVQDLVAAGVARKRIANIVGVSEDILMRHYKKEMAEALDLAIEAVSKKAFEMALDGSEKMAQFILRTKGRKHGWQETALVENVTPDEFNALKQRIDEVEQKESKEY